MELHEQAERLIAHFDALGLQPNTAKRGWDHMGGVLSDAALQRRAKYHRVVLPRVRDLISAWPDADTVTGFRRRMEHDSLAEVLRWTRPAKLQVIADLTDAMTDLRVDTVTDLRDLLTDDQLRPSAVQRLRVVHNVGPKTADYLAILVGSDDHIAIDVHLFNFAAQAGVPMGSYDGLRRVMTEVSKQRGWTLASLDAAIWQHMSAASQGARRAQRRTSRASTPPSEHP
ncbi:hypothetical protein AB0B66_18800 [Catellatospora sp. NPDC049111]|uniref:hypothetical protein n=1 Tax=Catellatospora sp. NPDC049111 TaxID=3155271 RepID=UPI0033D5B662